MIIFVLPIVLQKSYCEWKSWHTNINMLVELFDMFQCTLMKGSIDTIAFGWLWSRIPSHAHTRHTRLEMPQKQEKGKGRQRENAWSSLHLVKRISRGSLIMVTNIADNGHRKTKGIRKVNWVIFQPNKPNNVKAYSSSLLHAIIGHNHLPFLKLFSNFLHFCTNFEIFFPFSRFPCSFSHNSQTLPFTF